MSSPSPLYTTAEAHFIHACKTGDMVEVALFYGLNTISPAALDAALHMAVKYDHPEVAHWVYKTIHDYMNFLAVPVPEPLSPTSPARNNPLNFPLPGE